jgi:hypothetical protein
MADTNNGTNQNNQSAQKPGQAPVVVNSSNPANPNNNIVRNWLGAIAGVLVILIAITYVVHRNDATATLASDTGTSTMAAATSTAATTTTVTSTAGVAMSFTPLAGTLMTASQGEAVAASNQPAGSSVEVSSMTLARKSWLAVMASDGSILGAGLFPADATSGTIPLQRDTVAGSTYEVVIYADDGDDIFNFRKDLLVMNTDKSPVGAMFTVQ